MKLFAKTALGALLLAGATALTVAPADARISIGLGFGGGGYYAPPYYAYCDPYSRWYDPYRCDDYDGYDDYYSGPVFIDGIWFNGPFRSRFHGGHHEFWRNGWHSGSGFRTEGFRRDGRFGGERHFGGHHRY